MFNMKEITNDDYYWQSLGWMAFNPNNFAEWENPYDCDCHFGYNKMNKRKHLGFHCAYVFTYDIVYVSSL